jgi:hypothetical protein
MRDSDKALNKMRGFDHYLVEPPDMKVLLALIEKAGGGRTGL